MSFFNRSKIINTKTDTGHSAISTENEEKKALSSTPTSAKTEPKKETAQQQEEAHVKTRLTMRPGSTYGSC